MRLNKLARVVTGSGVRVRDAASAPGCWFANAASAPGCGFGNAASAPGCGFAGVRFVPFAAYGAYGTWVIVVDPGFTEVPGYPVSIPKQVGVSGASSSGARNIPYCPVCLAGPGPFNDGRWAVVQQRTGTADRPPCNHPGSKAANRANRLALGWPEPRRVSKPPCRPRTRRKRTLFWNPHLVHRNYRRAQIHHGSITASMAQAAGRVGRTLFTGLRAAALAPHSGRAEVWGFARPEDAEDAQDTQDTEHAEHAAQDAKDAEDAEDAARR
jgi:hypothetical protein